MLYRIDDKDWSKIRREIKNLANNSITKESGRATTNVKRMSFGVIALEGGIIPITFDVFSYEMYVHSRGARHAGGKINVEDLISIQQSLVEYFELLKTNELKPLTTEEQ